MGMPASQDPTIKVPIKQAGKLRHDVAQGVINQQGSECTDKDGPHQGD